VPSSSVDHYLPPLTEKSRRWLRFLGLVLAVWVLGYLTLKLSSIITPLVAGMAAAYILNPAVTWLERQRNVSRFVSVTSGLAILVIVVGLLTFALAIQLLALGQDLPTYWDKFVVWINLQFPTLVGSLNANQLTKLAGEHGGSIGARLLGLATATLSNAGYYLTVVVLVPLYTFFFLIEFNQITRVVHDHLPNDYRDTIVRIVMTIDRAIAAFFRGRVVVSAIVGTLSGLGWMIVGVNHSLLLGAAVAVLNLVPFLSIAALPAAMVIAYAGVGPEESWALPVIGAMAVYLVVQAIESFVLTPGIEAKASGLHPVTTVIALLIGGQMAGLLGMLLAIPIASTLKSLGAEYVMPEVRRLAAQHASAATDAPDANEAAGKTPEP
jgi:predicted PurR-regulated permease PerM